jgi:TPP-dependent pyruvate/acetoin dehydrogenase alpha subunit
VATAIVGGSTILATGAALASQVLDDGRIGVAFLGDRTLNEGAVYEAFNLASLWSLPVLYVCENNNAAPHNPNASGLSVAELTDVARSFRIAAETVDATDPTAAHDAAQDAIAQVRSGQRPLFLETRTPRWPGNAGQDPSLEITGRTDVSTAWSPPPSDPMEAWHRADPILRLVRLGMEEEVFDQAAVARLDGEVRGLVDQAVAAARSAPAPASEMAIAHALASGDLWPPVGVPYGWK